jgi:hypothetical protein
MDKGSLLAGKQGISNPKSPYMVLEILFHRKQKSISTI